MSNIDYAAQFLLEFLNEKSEDEPFFVLRIWRVSNPHREYGIWCGINKGIKAREWLDGCVSDFGQGTMK